jgi:hypothetical protein
MRLLLIFAQAQMKSFGIVPSTLPPTTKSGGFKVLLKASFRHWVQERGFFLIILAKSGIQQSSTYTEREVLSFHSLGKSSIPKLQQTLAELGLSFKTAIHL